MYTKANLAALRVKKDIAEVRHSALGVLRNHHLFSLLTRAGTFVAARNALFYVFRLSFLLERLFRCLPFVS